jgi:hypothetical protein
VSLPTRHGTSTKYTSVAKLLHFICLIKNDVNYTGMEVFMNGTAMFGVVTKNLLNMPPEWKEALHMGLQDAIKRGVVQPLECAVFPRQHAQLAFR